ncbi:protein-tyrosine phosphatase-like protein, partial [Bombardia bombarda]
LPSPPFIKVPGLANLRDVGGYQVSDQPGKAIRRGLLFRAAEPSKVSAEGVTVLQGLGITHVYDLRSVIEVARTTESAGQSPSASGNRSASQPDEAWPGAKRFFVPVFLDRDYSPEALAIRFRNYSDGPEGFVRAYETILDAAAEPTHPYAPFRTIMDHLASASSSSTAPPSPLLVHCTAGKDRNCTGVLCALVLALCGVPDEAIAHEYSLTDLGLAERKDTIVQHLIQTPALFGDRAKAEVMVGASKDNMLGTLNFIREKYGSVESYVVDHCNISLAQVDQLRRNLIVDISDTEPPLD